MLPCRSSIALSLKNVDLNLVKWVVVFPVLIFFSGCNEEDTGIPVDSTEQTSTSTLLTITSDSSPSPSPISTQAETTQTDVSSTETNATTNDPAMTNGLATTSAPAMTVATSNTMTTSESSTPAAPAIDTVSPIAGSSGAMSATVGATSAALSWTSATDNVTLASALQYKVYYSTQNNLGSVLDVELNGVAANSYTSALTTFQVTGLTVGSTYYFNVIVKDEAGNKAIYSQISGTTSDVTGPVVGQSGTISVSSISTKGATISWTAATDDGTLAPNLQYRLYYSIQDNVSNVAEMEANGRPVNAFTAALTSLTVNTLVFNRRYYVNVMVKDASGNKSSYTRTSFTTLAASSWTNMGNPFTITYSKTAALAIGSDDKPVVVSHNGTSSAAAIKAAKWVSGTSWTDLGSPGNSMKSIAMALDPADGKPVVIYCDSSNSTRPTVKKWDVGTTWNTVGGTTINNSACDYAGIAIDSDSVISVAFKDGANSSYLSVYRYISGAWVSAGTVDSNAVISIPRIAVGSDKLPVVVFRDSGTHPHVMKWVSGTTWTDLDAVSSGAYSYFRLALDTAGSPIVSFGNGSNSVASVSRWSSSQGNNVWTSLGDSVDSQYRQAPVAVDTYDNLPYMLYSQSVAAQFPKLKKSDGSVFSDVGTNPIINNQTLTDESYMVMDSVNHPIVLMKDSSGKVIIYTLK